MLWALALAVMGGCSQPAEHFEPVVMNGMTPVKDQGQSQLCWAYAMLAAIETEHIMRGDSVNLSPAYIEYWMKHDHVGPKSGRAMGATLLSLMSRYGMVGYEVYNGSGLNEKPPHRVFMLGADYTPLEFAHSVCTPDEYLLLTTTKAHPYGETVELDVPDNWAHHRFLNVHPDTLLVRTERAVRNHHGVCWEGDTSEQGYDYQRGVARLGLIEGRTTDDHAMAIVGIARDEAGAPYFIMKNSWGKTNCYGGLVYMSFDYFRKKTIAIYMTSEAYRE